MHVVVINSRKIAEELIEGRPEIYNDRPVLPVVDMCACFLRNLFMDVTVVQDWLAM